VWVALICAAIVACGSAAKQSGLDQVLGSMSPQQRHDNFQDVATVLEQHPDWIDQFYDVAKAHPALMKRFLVRATHDLKEPQMAKMTGELLAAEPASLEQVLLSTVDAAKSRPDARAAINRAVAARAESMSDIMTDSPATLEAVTRGMLTVARRKPAAKEALRKSVGATSDRIVEFAADEPDFMSAMTRSVLEAAAKDKSSLSKLLKELHVL
jgi:hypothetical protein